MKTPPRAVVYCRVSTQEQATEDHHSLKNQKKRARGYIRSRAWTLLDIHENPESGRDAKRDAYQQLLHYVKQRRCDVGVVYRLDRLSRNVKDIHGFVDLAY